jgi:replicative DNA helicase
VIGSVLLLPAVLFDVASIVDAGDFYDPAHAQIFAAIRHLRDSGRPIDPTLLVNRLKETGEFDSIGPAYLSKVLNCVPNAAHAVYYAEIVARHALSRSVIHECTRLITAAYDGDEPRELVRRMQSQATALAATRQGASAPRLLGEIADEVAASLETNERIDRINRAAWGLWSVDERLGPLMGGEVAVVAARPGMGKTAWGFQMLRHSAEMERPSIFVSLEMTGTELAGRDLARLADIDSRKIRRGEIDDSDRQAIRNAQREIGDLPLYVWAPAVATLADIRNVLQRAIERHGVTLACIDYLSLIQVESAHRKEMRHEQVAALSRGLKRLAKELQIPLVVLQQLNREADNAEPRLSNLRESGAVEQDADIVMFLHHGLVGKKAMPPNQRLVLVPKFRAGPMGNITVNWDGRRTRFSDPQAAECAAYDENFDRFNEREF